MLCCRIRGEKTWDYSWLWKSPITYLYFIFHCCKMKIFTCLCLTSGNKGMNEITGIYTGEFTAKLKLESPLVTPAPSKALYLFLCGNFVNKFFLRDPQICLLVSPHKNWIYDYIHELLQRNNDTEVQSYMKLNFSWLPSKI